ncbi:magnesium or manganese-dependent protein phosphatase [Streptomyces viridochromogenes DSM 40736]|uniref:Magnesium or manganese-dependent protein phosphatase n=1 Tax=Streptomyces viridochromogenes (strain DSM 40736 / JCM 4977 / BCRC 1201 / Tue 494) TaxID=591159 RepID=D9XDN4_STRVT|nr:SpoIIE family protein phosphatase [Streptomyces viridochromogenes]EFL30413.1 magnesium or manganese-dependent protein phosphatase [Streptomyces viridochromogenes DSM 40736]
MEGRVPEDLAVVVDAGGAITVWSDGARRLLGYEPAEIVGRSVTGLLAAALPESTRRHVADGQRWSGEVALRHRDGDRVVVRLKGTPLLDAAGGRLWLVTGTVPAPTAGRPARRTVPLWDLTLSQLPVPVAVYDRDARLVAANEIMTEVMGRSEEEMKGLTLWEIEPHPPFDEYDRLQRQVLRTGEMIFHEDHSKAPGETRPHAWSMFMSPLKDETGAVQGVSATVFDTTEQYWARRRLAVLNDAALRIGSTLDVALTADELSEVAVAGFADFVTVDLLESVALGDEPRPVPTDAPVTVRRTAQRSVLPGCPESVIATGDTTLYPVGTLPARTLAAGRGARHRPGDPGLREWIRSSPARAETVARHMIHSVMLVPLRARGVTLGLVHFLRHRTPESFSEDDLLLAEEIVARAAVSVDNARRYTRERRTALALQRSLLPDRPPDLAAMEVAYRYLPTGSGADIGGDWFDVIPLSGARVALVVGDVVGHGIHASATMGRLRTAVRTLADVDLAPDELLTQLDDLVIRLDREEGPEVRGRAAEPSGQVGATCLYAVYDPVSRRCTVARAGHPSPALVTADGEFRFLDLPAGPPLGLGGLPFEAVEVELEEDSLLALYTDGLIEAADHDIEVGIGLLRRALGSPAGTLEETCDHVLRTVLVGRPADDVVLMLARTAALDAGRVRTWQLPPDPAAVARARKTAGEQLAAWGLTEAAFTTELIVSELVTNALRYGGAPIELRLIRDTTLICEVSDGSNTAPHLRRARVFDEGGRGLLLVAQLSERWGSRQTPTGKTIWAEQSLPDETSF